MKLPQRKTVRLKGYDYNTPGYYFVTLCTQDKRKVLCDIVGTGLPDGPKIRLLPLGRIADTQLKDMANYYENVVLEKYVIMPNHVHLLIHLLGETEHNKAVSPTNSKISQFVGSFKRFCNKAYGRNEWQARSYDHIIRGEKDFLKIWQYIEENPTRWTNDCFYTE